MEKVDRKKLVKIAKQVRGWAEKNKEEYEVNDTDLCGMCAVASAMIFKKLEEKKIICEIFESESEKHGSHVFVVAGGYIIDVTATQYGFDPVFVEKEEDFKKLIIYKKTRKYKNHIHLRNTQQKTGWPEHQIIKKEHI
jgi:hypothetical protein